MKKRRIILGMTGASGVVYGLRLLDLLLARELEVHLVASPTWPLVACRELDILQENSPRAVNDAFLRECRARVARFYFSEDPACRDGDRDCKNLRIHSADDFTASIASGSFPVDAMVIAPCSGGTLGFIANGTHRHLLHRAAEVQLKERRPLVLLLRESPLSLIHLENMRAVTLAGGIVQPASPHFYVSQTAAPKTTDLIDSVIARTLDLLKIEHEFPTWE